MIDIILLGVFTKISFEIMIWIIIKLESLIEILRWYHDMFCFSLILNFRVTKIYFWQIWGHFYIYLIYNINFQRLTSYLPKQLINLVFDPFDHDSGLKQLYYKIQFKRYFRSQKFSLFSYQIICLDKNNCYLKLFYIWIKSEKFEVN